MHERMAQLVVSLNALVFLVIVPGLEINETHVFNPQWPSHARLHEVWQLGTNALLALAALFFMWSQRNVRMATFLSLLPSAPFVFAYVIRASYGGSMEHTDGSQLLVAGVNPAFGLLLFLTLALSALWVTAERRSDC